MQYRVFAGTTRYKSGADNSPDMNDAKPVDIQISRTAPGRKRFAWQGNAAGGARQTFIRTAQIGLVRAAACLERRRRARS
jgi:hypothetical protein